MGHVNFMSVINGSVGKGNCPNSIPIDCSSRVRSINLPVFIRILYSREDRRSNSRASEGHRRYAASVTSHGYPDDKPHERGERL